MSRSRHFTNALQDFPPGSKVAVDPQSWVPRIKGMVESIVKGMPPTPDNCDGSLYVGCVGVAYMLDYVAGFDLFSDVRPQYLAKAREYTDVSLAYCKSKHCRDPRAAFILGPAGVHLVGGLVYSHLGQEETGAECRQKYASLCAACEPINYLECGSDEILVGRAGYICGALHLNRKFGEVLSPHFFRFS